MKEQKKVIVYYRVSTKKQGMYGLGMDAQKTAVDSCVKGRNFVIVDTFTEVESGGNCKRKALGAALAECRRISATLIIAKLDRLSRDVGFVDALIKSDIRFICADMPDAGKVMLQMSAILGEYERDQVSIRTKMALAEAKKRGIRLGNPVRAAQSDVWALSLRSKIEDAKACGAQSMKDIGEMLNMHTTQVWRVVKRLERIDKEAGN